MQPAWPTYWQKSNRAAARGMYDRENYKMELLNVNETAAMLRLKQSTIRSWILKKKLACVKLGQRVFIRRTDADAIIAANLVLPSTPNAPQEVA